MSMRQLLLLHLFGTQQFYYAALEEESFVKMTHKHLHLKYTKQ